MRIEKRILPKNLRTLARALAALCVLAGTAGAAQVDLEIGSGVLAYRANDVTFGPPNDLTISLASGVYTIDEPGEGAIALGAGALAAGCVPVDADTVTCPAAAVTSLDVATYGGEDSIVLVGVSAPSEIAGGGGNDVIVGGDGADTFLWSSGDGSDTIDGGPGADALLFRGADTTENFDVTAEGTGFDLARNGAVPMDVDGVELLELDVGGGSDSVTTAALVGTVQYLLDGDGFTDQLTVDANGSCAQRVNDVSGNRYEVAGHQPIYFFPSDFPFASAIDSVCGALLDVGAGVLRYSDVAQSANQLRVKRDGDWYLVDDPGEAAISLEAGAIAAGCVAVDANTARCPQVWVASFDIRTGEGDDVVDLAASLVPSTIEGGVGNDVLVGGEAADTFLWSFHEGNADSIDGGPGDDALVFTGFHSPDFITIEADGAGFVLHREPGNVSIDVQATELLEVSTLEGEDHVWTTGLVETTQRFIDGDDGISTDVLTIDAAGLCAAQFGDGVEIENRQPIEFTRFSTVVVENACTPDPCQGAIATQGCTVNGVPNQLCVGTSGDDRIVGTAGNDVILGGDGKDRIRAGKGADLVCGERGNDTIGGGSEDDTLVGGAGEDRLKGDAGNDRLDGGRDRDILIGSGGDDQVDGGEGDDWVRGTGGTDVLQGGPGLDVIDGGGGIDSCADVDQEGPFVRCE